MYAHFYHCWDPASQKEEAQYYLNESEIFAKNKPFFAHIKSLRVLQTVGAH